MKKWGSVFMLVAMLATPILACGFPLPTGTTTGLSEVVCATDEAADTCQERQDAYQMMNKLQSAVVTDLSMVMVTSDEEDPIEMYITGSFDFVATDSPEGLGANIHAKLDTGTFISNEGTESLDGMEFIIIGNTGYTTRDGGETWEYEELDDDAIQGLGFLLGLTGAIDSSSDMFADGSIFTVTIGSDAQQDGQTMHVQTLNVDLLSLFTAPDALSALMEQSAELSDGEDVSTEEEFDPAEMAMFAPMLVPMFEGSEFNTTLYIGADDGLIHRIEDRYVLNMDASLLAFGTEETTEEPQQISMTYELSGNITQHNVSLTIEAPANATEGTDILSGDGLFGGGNLGGDLFGE